ncbi:MAG TPA: Uma2 family endonuclease [Ktedonobacteraceae bacterium]|nr:Uma2 family endonuclease [Ktedonobacteraceae bacterium]
MVAKRNTYMTVKDFLALDRENLDQRYEFIDGEMVAMAGGSTNHTIIATNIASLLHLHLRKNPCTVLTEGTLKIEDECYLPDIMVTCNEQDLTENKTYIEHPKLVIEVLSPSTENYNRRDKLFVYTQCFSIQEYILVNWDYKVIQKMTRKDTQNLDHFQWIDQWYGENESVELTTIDLSIPVTDIYEKVTLPPFKPFRFRKKQNRT